MRNWASFRKISIFSARFSSFSASTAQTSPILSTSQQLLKPSSFTGKAQFYEALFFLDDVYLKVKDAINQTTQQISFQWLSKEKMQDKLGFEMSLLEYRQIRQRLNKIVPAAPASPNVSELLRVFGEPEIQKIKSITTASVDTNSASSSSATASVVDAFGRVTAMGKRKSSVAKVTIIPGKGECLVNGRQLTDYFPRYRDIFQISRPIAAVKQFGKFNIWALTRGGGLTGQSGAIKLGLAKALAVYNQEWALALDEAGLLKRDIRRVERKKPGQEKARKKFTWVKR